MAGWLCNGCHEGDYRQARMFLNQQVDAGLKATVYINGLSCSPPFSVVWKMPPVCSVLFCFRFAGQPEV